MKSNIIIKIIYIYINKYYISLPKTCIINLHTHSRQKYIYFLFATDSEEKYVKIEDEGSDTPLGAYRE